MPPPSLPLRLLFGIHWFLVRECGNFSLRLSPPPQQAPYSVALWAWHLRGRKGQVKHKSFFPGDSLRPASRGNSTLRSSTFLSIRLRAMETLLMLNTVPSPWAVQSFQPLFWWCPTLANLLMRILLPPKLSSGAGLKMIPGLFFYLYDQYLVQGKHSHRSRKQSGGYQRVERGKWGDFGQRIQSFSYTRWVSTGDLMYKKVVIVTILFCELQICGGDRS